MKNLLIRKFLKVIAILLIIALSVPIHVFVAAEDQSSALIYGDIDANGTVDAADALAVLKHAAKLQLLADTIIDSADVYVDSHVDSSDALWILRYAANMIGELPVIMGEEPVFTPMPTSTPATNNIHTAEITLIDGTAVITIYTKPFFVFDIGIISSATCSDVKVEKELNLNDDYTFSSAQSTNLKDADGNVYAGVTGAGCISADGSKIPYEGVLAKFTYHNVEEGTEFTVVYNTAVYSLISECPVLVKLTAEETDIILTEEPTEIPTVEPTLGPGDTPVPTIPVEMATPEPVEIPTPEPTATPTPDEEINSY